MKIPIYIYICIFCVLGCEFKSNDNTEVTNRLTAYVNEVSKKIATYDTMDNYVFKNISIEKKLDSNNYTNILIMGFLGKEDTVGYFRKKFNAIYYLDNDYMFLQVKSKQTNYNYIKMHEQLFFDFSFHENSIIKFVGQPPFDGLNTFIIKSIIFDTAIFDTIYACDRVDSLSTTYFSEGAIILKSMKIGKKVGVTELIFENTNKPKEFKVYIPKKGTSWKIFN